MANSNASIIDRWVEQVGRDEPRFLSDNGTRIAQDSKTIYSYGTHFPMARLIGDRATGYFLVNGDNYSVTTSQHQSHTRWAIKRSGIPFMVVPFSALHAASIDLDTIIPVDITKDRTERIEETWDSWDKLPRWLKWRTETRTSTEYKTEPCRQGPRGSLELYSWTGSKLVENHIHENDYPGTDHFTPYTHYEYVKVPTEPGEDGLWHHTRSRHFLGESVFRAKYQSGTTPVRHWRMVVDYDATYAKVRAEGKDWNDAGWKPVKKRHYWTENRPVWTEAYFLSGYDTQERGRYGEGLYFLAQLPEGWEPVTVAQAFEALKPAEVLAAENAGIGVVRQGDVYAIESHLRPATLKAMGAERPEISEDEVRAINATNIRRQAERADRMGYAYSQWERECKKLIGESNARLATCDNGHEPVDWIGPDPCFMCGAQDGAVELPPAPSPEPELEPLTRSPGMGRTERFVLGLNHTGTDVLVSPAGTTWARGMLRHKRLSYTWQGVMVAPTGEHKQVKLGDGKTWYRLVKNTVPEGRSWSIAGGVD